MRSGPQCIIPAGKGWLTSLGLPVIDARGFRHSLAFGRRIGAHLSRSSRVTAGRRKLGQGAEAGPTFYQFRKKRIATWRLREMGTGFIISLRGGPIASRISLSFLPSRRLIGNELHAGLAGSPWLSFRISYPLRQPFRAADDTI